MKRLKNSANFLAIAVLLSPLICYSDWKNDINKLGFYAIVDGKATPLIFVNLGDGTTERGLRLSDFPSLPVLKENDFIVLYGDMPTGPLGTTVEVFRYEFINANNRYVYIKNMGEANGFFSLSPLSPLNGYKLSKLEVEGKAIKSVYFLHKYVGADSDSYAGFVIGENTIAESKPSISKKDTLTNMSEEERIEIVARDIQAISAALANYITDNRIPPKQSGAYNEASPIYKALYPKHIKSLPIKDPWNNNYYIYCGTDVAGQYGIAKAVSDDFLIYSYGPLGRREDWIYNPEDPSYGFSGALANFNGNLISFNGAYIRSPRGMPIIELDAPQLTEPSISTSRETTPAQPTKPDITYSEADLITSLKQAHRIITGGKDYTVRWLDVPNSSDRKKIIQYLNDAINALNSSEIIARSLSIGEALNIISQCKGRLERDRNSYNQGRGGEKGLRDAYWELRTYLKGK